MMTRLMPARWSVRWQSSPSGSLGGLPGMVVEDGGAGGVESPRLDIRFRDESLIPGAYYPCVTGP